MLILLDIVIYNLTIYKSYLFLISIYYSILNKNIIKLLIITFVIYLLCNNNDIIYLLLSIILVNYFLIKQNSFTRYLLINSINLLIAFIFFKNKDLSMYILNIIIIILLYKKKKIIIHLFR